MYECMEAPSFLKGGFSDPGESQDSYVLQRSRGQIESICNLLDFGTNLQRVNANDIDEWERELRVILKEIKRLRDTSHIHSLLESSDGVQRSIESALDHLYIASDILQKRGTITIKEREKFYQKLRDASRQLSKAIGFFKI
jgi:hypothetical protein